MENDNIAIKNIFDEHEKFILIGLTGRTGSGCTTVKKILTKDNFNKLHMNTPKELNFEFNYERKERVVYNYALKHWKNGFQVISMTDIISTFVLRNGYKDLISYISNLNKYEYLKIKDISIEKNKEICDKIETLSEEINEIQIDIQKICDEDGFLKKEKEFFETECQLLKKISVLSEKLKQIIQGNKLTYRMLDGKGGKIFLERESDAYTFIYQVFGNNIRANGNVFSNVGYTGDNIFDISKMANGFIKAIHNTNKELKKETLIVLDAIRNPYEAQFFRDRYSSFYLMSVNTENDERIRRLSNINKNQIESIDEIENNKINKSFFSQDIAACIQLADIHIYNPKCNKIDNFFLTFQLVKYVMLMKHPGLITPTHVERCMQLAYNTKVNSGCISRQVGAVITGDDYSVKAVGWNDVPKGQVPCSLRDIKSYCKEKDESSYSFFEITDEKFHNKLNEMSDENREKYSDCFDGRLRPFCFKKVYCDIKGEKNQVYTRALHAEENAFLQLAKYSSGGIKDGFLFTTASPCELCSKKAYQLGVKKIFYIDPYPGISEEHTLRFGYGNDDPELNLFYGAIGRAYTNLFMQYLPIKDELEALEGKK